MNLNHAELCEDDAEIKRMLVEHGKQTYLIPRPGFSGPFRNHVVYTQGEMLYAITCFHGYPDPADNGYRALRIPVADNSPEDLSKIVNAFIDNGKSGPELYAETVADVVEGN